MGVPWHARLQRSETVCRLASGLTPVPDLFRRQSPSQRSTRADHSRPSDDQRQIICLYLPKSVIINSVPLRIRRMAPEHSAPRPGSFVATRVRLAACSYTDPEAAKINGRILGSSLLNPSPLAPALVCLLMRRFHR